MGNMLLQRLAGDSLKELICIYEGPSEFPS